MILTSRWLVIPQMLLFGLLPLGLCLSGALDINALIFSYALEAALILCIAELGEDWFDAGRIRLGGLTLATVCAVTAGTAMSWSGIVVSGIAAVIVAELAAIVWAARKREVTFTDAAGGPFGVYWRLAVVLVSLFGLVAATDYARLVEHEWTPSGTDDWWSPVPLLLVDGMVSLNVAPDVIPAVILVLFKTINEVLFEAIRILADEDYELAG